MSATAIMFYAAPARAFDAAVEGLANGFQPPGPYLSANEGAQYGVYFWGVP